jgi:hypothetical protein
MGLARTSAFTSMGRPEKELPKAWVYALRQKRRANISI